MSGTQAAQSAQRSMSFYSPLVTEVIAGFIIQELLTQMSKYCQTLSAFTAEIVVKSLLL